MNRSRCRQSLSKAKRLRNAITDPIATNYSTCDIVARSAQRGERPHKSFIKCPVSFRTWRWTTARPANAARRPGGFPIRPRHRCDVTESMSDLIFDPGLNACTTYGSLVIFRNPSSLLRQVKSVQFFVPLLAINRLKKWVKNRFEVLLVFENCFLVLTKGLTTFWNMKRKEFMFVLGSRKRYNFHLIMFDGKMISNSAGSLVFKKCSKFFGHKFHKRS